MSNEEEVIDLIRKIIDESRLTVIHQSGSIIDVDENKRENEIEEIVHTIVSEALDVYYLFLDNEEDEE